MQFRWCCRLVPSRLLRLCLLAAVWLAGLAGGALVWAMTEPGTFLYNQAEVRYFDPLEGRVYSVRSNVSRVMIAERADFTLFDAKDKVAAPGQTVEIAHRLVNTGNAADTYTLTLENQADDSLDLNELGAYHDLNGNGVVDPGEPRLDTLPKVLPGEGLELVIRGTLPATAVDGQLARLRLVVSSVKNPAARVVIEDSVKARNGAAFTLAKQSSASCQAPQPEGSTLSYQVTATNNGNQAPPARDIRVNGNPARGVLIEDPLAANVRLLADQSPSMAPQQSRLLVQPVGNAPDDYLAFDDWQGEPVEQVALLVPVAQLAPNSSAEFTFKVEIKRGLTHGTQLYNQAQVNLGEGITFKSRAVCNQVETSLAPEIRFQQAGPEVVGQGRAPRLEEEGDFVDANLYRLLPTSAHRVLRDGIFLRIKATQLTQSVASADFFYTNPAGIRLFTATVSSSGTGDSVDVVVRETAPDSGVFRSIYPLVLTPENDQAQVAESAPPIARFSPLSRLGEWLGVSSALAQSQSSSQGALADQRSACPGNVSLQNIQPYADDTTTASALAKGCSLTSRSGDRLSARFEAPVFGPDNSVYQVEAVTDLALVDAVGTVFDAATGAPVEGAEVSLWQSRLPLSETKVESCQNLNASDFVPAREANSEKLIDPINTLGSASADARLGPGQYQFWGMQQGYCYHYAVEPPQGYTFPSQVEPTTARQLYPNTTPASWGRAGIEHSFFNSFEGQTTGESLGAFLYNNALLQSTRGAFVDIPLDPDASELMGELTIDKQVDEETAAVGDIVSYTVEITNHADQPLYNVQLDDRPAYGFRYIERSAWLEQKEERIEIPAPISGPGSQLNFRMMRKEQSSLQPLPLAPDSSITLHYAMRLSAGALDSDGINRAVATANTRAGYTYRSNQDEAEVEVRNEGVLSDRAIVFGKVYVDSDCNNQQSEGEWPIAGVRLYLQDGTWVITDENGQFSLFDLRPELYTLKVDTLTLPQGLTLKPLDNRHAADGESRFVDLRSGDMHRADFAAACPDLERSAALIEELKARNADIDGNWMLDDALRFDPLSPNNGNTRRQADGSGGLGSGTYSNNEASASEDASLKHRRQGADQEAASTPQQEPPREQMPETEQIASQITFEQADAGEWLWPKDGISADGRLQVVVHGGMTPTLVINDTPLNDDYLGEQILNRRERAQVISWYGVPLEEGVNQVKVVTEDNFGNQRELASTEIVRPGPAASLSLKPAAQTLLADGGRSTLSVQVHVKDALGYPARGTHFVTLENARGAWQEQDLQPETPGFQVRVREGEAQVHLRSTDQTGPVELKARLDELTTRARLQQVAPIRPLVATGFIQGRHTLGSLSSQGEQPTLLAADVPQQGTDKRAALFLKGGVRGDMHLTLAYDSDNKLDEEDEIRRDLNPEDYYPIGGDASVRGYDARSDSNFYAKLEKNRNSLMWGDYLTDSDADRDDLGRVMRTLTGINAVLENDRTRLQVFGAESDYEQVSEEIKGNGTAMLFTLSNRPRRGSETLERVIRDKDNLGLDKSSTTLQRNVDYSVNYFTGDIRFFDVIPSVDDDNNPVIIRASYELENQSDQTSTVLGARLRHQFTDEMQATLSHTHDNHDESGYALSSLLAKYQLDDQNTLYGSVATMSNQDDGSDGQAVSIGARRQWQHGGSTELRWARAEDGFRNSAGGINENREEARLEHRQPLTSRLTANLEAIHSKRLDSDDEDTSIGLINELQLGSTRLTAGARRIEQRDEDDTERFTTAIIGAQRSQSIFDKSLSLGVEFEQAMDNSDRQRLTADAELGITDNTRLYARYELKDSLGGINQLSNDEEQERLSLGVRSSVSDSTEVFSEYRLDGTRNGQDTAVASGVRSDLEVLDGVTVSPSFEWINAVEGDDNQDSTALSVAVEDLRDDNRRTLARLETRFEDQRTYYGMTAANVWRVNQDWSAVVRNDLRLQEFDAQAREGDNIVTLGAARRPLEDNRHHMLFMYKWKEKWGGENGNDSTVHLLSNHHNYQAHEDWILSGRLGGKWQTTELDAFNRSTQAYIADGRVIWDINRRFDVDLHGGLLATGGTNELRYSFGLGLNALVRRNLRLGVGYNVVGFRDEDLDPQGYNAEGVYIGLEFKFDESSFDWLSATAADQRNYMGESQ